MKEAVVYFKTFDDIVARDMEALVEALDLKGVLNQLNLFLTNDGQDDGKWSEEDAGNFIVAWKEDPSSHKRN